MKMKMLMSATVMALLFTGCAVDDAVDEAAEKDEVGTASASAKDLGNGSFKIDFSIKGGSNGAHEFHIGTKIVTTANINDPDISIDTVPYSQYTITGFSYEKVEYTITCMPNEITRVSDNPSFSCRDESTSSPEFTLRLSPESPELKVFKCAYKSIDGRNSVECKDTEILITAEGI